MKWTRRKVGWLTVVLLIVAGTAVTMLWQFGQSAPSAPPNTPRAVVPPETPRPVISRFCALIDDTAARNLLGSDAAMPHDSARFRGCTMQADLLAGKLSGFLAGHQMPVLSPNITAIDTHSSYIQNDVFVGSFQVRSADKSAVGVMRGSGEAIFVTMGDRSIRLTLHYRLTTAFNDGFSNEGQILYRGPAKNGLAVVFVGPPIQTAGLRLRAMVVWIETREMPAAPKTIAWIRQATTIQKPTSAP